LANEKAKEIDFGGDFGAAALKINGVCLEIGEDGKSINIASNTPVTVTVTANINTPQTSTAVGAAKEALEIGDRMKDGTIVIAVDLKMNIALFVPEDIFGGNSTLYHQAVVVAKANAQNLHGKKDWRRITDEEANSLAKDWDKVAPPALQGHAAPWFWGAFSYFGSNSGRVYRGGEADCSYYHRNNSRPVPVVRSGPALK